MLYWLYLVIFVGVVFVPDIISGGLFGLREQVTEELAIFMLVGIGFSFYLIKDNQLKKNAQEKAKAQRDASSMSKDLTSSYSFIGEINRKLEIFKNISLGLPIWSRIPRIREKEAYEYIMAAIKIITRADEYSLRFVNKESHELLLEVKSKKNLKLAIHIEECLAAGKKYFETPEFMITLSPEEIAGNVCIITIRKKNNVNASDDPDILKAIASQALFLFMFSRKDKA